MFPSTCEQSAGLSTAESESSIGGNKYEAISSSCQAGGGNVIITQNITNRAAEPRPPDATSPRKRGLFSMASQKRRSSNKSEDGISLNQSITNSAPTVLINTPSISSNDDPFRRRLVSSMSSRTLHDSLHKGRTINNRPGTRDRSVSFSQVNIREYERVLGDNPSVRSGPPLAIGWRHVAEPTVINVDDYEDGKGMPRSSSEYLVPKMVRENLLKEHAGVTRRQMVNSVRAIQKEKAQRRKTVVNLNMQKTEERLEGAKRKIKKILKHSSSYETPQSKLWDDAHVVAIEKAKRLEESIRKGESVSMRNVYSVGTPSNNMLPSRGNSTRGLQNCLEEEKREESLDTTSAAVGENDLSLDLVVENNDQKSAMNQELPQSSVGALDEPHDQHTSVNNKVEIPARMPAKGRGPHRTSANIVACESESEEIFAKLVLDDASNES